MEMLELKSARPRFFITVFFCCTTLLVGCNISVTSDTSDTSDTSGTSAQLIQTESTSNFSMAPQKLGSDKYKSSSIIGEIARSEIASQKYNVTATFVVPNHTSNK
jgi:hypothetical protein